MQPEQVIGQLLGALVGRKRKRMYLTQLARSLRLPHEDVETIERDALGKE